MPFTVRADVVDLRHDVPRLGDEFLADTNVLYFMAYPRASLRVGQQKPQPYQLNDYPQYINAILPLVQAGEAKLFHSPLSYSELAHQIERCEYEIYGAANHANITLKEFRQNATERARVVELISDVWDAVLGMTTCLPIALDDAAVAAAHRELATAEIDSYDAHMLASAKAAGCLSIISDDADFASVPGITLFSAAPKARREASFVGRRLVQRAAPPRPAVSPSAPSAGRRP